MSSVKVTYSMLLCNMRLSKSVEVRPDPKLHMEHGTIFVHSSQCKLLYHYHCKVLSLAGRVQLNSTTKC